MQTRSALPPKLVGRPYPAAVFTSSLVAGLVIAVYGLISGLPGVPFRIPTTIVVLDVLVGVACGAIAWGGATGRISSARGVEASAAIVATLIYWVVLAEITAMPARANHLTAHCFIVLVGAGVIVRSRWALGSLVVGALSGWSATVLLVQPPGFRPGGWFATWVIAILITLLAHIVVTVERSVEADVRHATESSSWNDALTGLVNRHGFLAQGPRLVAAARRSDDMVWCAFVDVDHFKSVNDRLGHQAGDDVLAAVAAALRDVARASDLPARWGGDEFVLLGQGSAPDEQQLEARITARLSRLDPAVIAAWTPKVTVGVAEAFVRDGDPTAELLVAADRRMYAQRRSTVLPLP